MYRFGRRSLDNLLTCDNRIIEILRAAIEQVDFTVLAGHRDEDAQMRAYNEGKSTKPWPKSKHNSFPSKAVDVAPWPIDWNDRERFAHLAGIITATARQLGYKLRWGGDWDMDGNMNYRDPDNSWDDLPHFEILD